VVPLAGAVAATVLPAEVGAPYPHPVATTMYEARNSHPKPRASIRPVDVMAHSYFDRDGCTQPTPEMVREAGSRVECREMSTVRAALCELGHVFSEFSGTHVVFYPRLFYRSGNGNEPMRRFGTAATPTMYREQDGRPGTLLRPTWLWM
jgi:hypothetical protein